MKLAKADLVPTEVNLLPAYASFADLEAACEVFCQQVNARVHRVTRRAPVQMLAEEQTRLHPLPAAPHTVALGLTRTVRPPRRWSPSRAGSTPSRTNCSGGRSTSGPTAKAPTNAW